MRGSIHDLIEVFVRNFPKLDWGSSVSSIAYFRNLIELLEFLALPSNHDHQGFNLLVRQRAFIVKITT